MVTAIIGALTHGLAWLQRHFWVPMLAALLVGAVVPDVGRTLEPTFKPALVAMLTLVFAKLDLADVLQHVRRPWLLVYLVAMKLVVLPLAVYLAARPLGPGLAVGLLLLAALPPAGSAPVFCDLVAGNTALGVAMYAASYLAVPFTLTLVMAVTQQAELDMWGLFRSLTLLVFAPVLLSLGLKLWAARWVARTRHLYSGLNLLIVIYLIFAVVSAQARELRADWLYLAGLMVVLYGFFAVQHLIGYGMVWWRPEGDRLAVSVSTAYMNTALGVVLAFKFFPPAVVLVAVASEVPWSTLLGPFRWLHRRWARRRVR
jgi:predicted Na+-dependent transporter